MVATVMVPGTRVDDAAALELGAALEAGALSAVVGAAAALLLGAASGVEAGAAAVSPVVPSSSSSPHAARMPAPSDSAPTAADDCSRNCRRVRIRSASLTWPPSLWGPTGRH
jgi:hypothetical protein